MQHRKRETAIFCVSNDMGVLDMGLAQIFSGKSQFCMQYSDGHIHVWRLWGNRLLSACIRYLHRSPATGVMVWAAIGYMTLISLVWIYRNLNANWYISDILLPVVVPYLRGLPDTIFQQDNARPHVASCVFFLSWYTGYLIAALACMVSTSGHGLLRDLPTTPLQLICLMSCPFLNSKTSSTPCLTG